MNLIIPKDYNPVLDLRDTEIAIKLVKDFFEQELAKALNLTRVSAPNRRDRGNCPLPGQVEAAGPEDLRFLRGRRPLHGYERHPPG